MTDRSKYTLDGIDWKFRDGSFTGTEKDAIREALQLAQEVEGLKAENEKLRKERDELRARIAELEAVMEARGM